MRNPLDNVPSAPLLSVSSVSVSVRGRLLLSDITLHVRSGDWLMVTGPNGAGKTTLIRALSQVIPSSGSMELDGKDIRSLKQRELGRSMGVLMQSGFSQASFTIRETVAMGRYAYRSSLFSPMTREDEACIREGIENAGLAGMEDKRLNTCSGGELQRVAFAQLIAQQPRLLLLDEPTNHLDLPYQKQLFSWVEEWRRQEGHAVISVVHDLSLARLYGTHALLLKDGNAVSQGPLPEALSDEALHRAYGMDVAAWEKHLSSVWQ